MVAKSLSFTNAEKLDAVELEIMRRKRVFGRRPEPHQFRQIEVMKAVALDIRACMERTDDSDSNRLSPGMAGGLARDAEPRA